MDMNRRLPSDGNLAHLSHDARHWRSRFLPGSSSCNVFLLHEPRYKQSLALHSCVLMMGDLVGIILHSTERPQRSDATAVP